MARWKSHIRLPIRHNWTFFAGSYRWGTTRQNVSTRCYQKGVGQFEPRCQGKGSSLGNIFWFLQNYTHFAIWQCKLHLATCRRFDTIPACDRETDGRTDGNAVSRALAMRALRRDEKTTILGKFWHFGGSCTDELLPMRIKFGVLQQAEGLHWHAKFYLNVFLCRLPVAKNHNFGQILTFWGLLYRPLWPMRAKFGVL